MGHRHGYGAFADVLLVDVDAFDLPRCLDAEKALVELGILHAELVNECRKSRFRHGKHKAVVSGLSPGGPQRNGGGAQRLDWPGTEATCDCLPTQNPEEPNYFFAGIIKFNAISKAKHYLIRTYAKLPRSLQEMGFFSKSMDRGRGIRIEKDMDKVGPVVQILRADGRAQLFGDILFFVMKRATGYASNMTQKGQQSYGMDLQIRGLRIINKNMIEGASIWLAGAFIESNATDTNLCADLFDFFFDLIQKIVDEGSKDMSRFEGTPVEDIIRP